MKKRLKSYWMRKGSCSTKRKRWRKKLRHWSRNNKWFRKSTQLFLRGSDSLSWQTSSRGTKLSDFKKDFPISREFKSLTTKAKPPYKSSKLWTKLQSSNLFFVLKISHQSRNPIWPNNSKTFKPNSGSFPRRIKPTIKDFTFRKNKKHVNSPWWTGLW